MAKPDIPGQSAIASKGWLRAHKWLLLRRSSQLGILLLFLLGPWMGIWIVKGNLASSLTLETLPLTDPYVLLQSLFASHGMETTALIGVLIVTVFYVLAGGRVYCAWVCPMNMVTDLASWLRIRLNIKGAALFPRSVRYWLLGTSLLLALLTGTMAWELVNPVSLLHRGIIFGMGFGWAIVLAVFLFELFVENHGWCGRLCPQGAFYSLLATVSPLRVSASAREHCNDCMDCYVICPEPQVISPALRGEEKNIGPVILSPNCTNCGRCIDVCSKDVFHFSTRFHNNTLSGSKVKTEVTP